MSELILRNQTAGDDPKAHRQQFSHTLSPDSDIKRASCTTVAQICCAEAVKHAALVADVDQQSTSVTARAACDAFFAALARGQEALGAVERAIGGSMVARDGTLHVVLFTIL